MTASQDIIRLMLARARASGGGDEDFADAADYDWDSPHNLPRPLMVDVQHLLDRSAEQLSGALSKLAREEVTVKAGDATEAYAESMGQADPDDGRVFIPLTARDELPHGYLSAPNAEAVQWVAKLLGGSAGGQGREMSALELSLLGDIMASFATAILTPICAAADVEITPGRTVSRQVVPLGDPTAEFVKVDFSVADEDDERLVVTAAIACDAIVAAVADAEHQARQSGPDVRKHIIEHLSRVSVTAVATLGQTETTVRQAAALGVGDVLVLDTCLGDPVDVLVQGKKVIRGTPVSCDGYNAIQVAEGVTVGARDGQDDSNA